MEKLTFSTNWNNKLDCKCFTTLRISNRLQPGQLVEVWQRKGKGEVLHGTALVVDHKVIPNLEQISNWIAFLDTGYSASECREIIRKMYPKIIDWKHQPINYYLLKYVDQSAE